MTNRAPATRVQRVTVTRKGKVRKGDATAERYTVSFDALPGRTFGPWGFRETYQDLTVSALLSWADARALVLDTWESGSASRPVEGGA
jgi:hypothetical protein